MAHPTRRDAYGRQQPPGFYHLGTNSPAVPSSFISNQHQYADGHPGASNPSYHYTPPQGSPYASSHCASGGPERSYGHENYEELTPNDVGSQRWNEQKIKPTDPDTYSGPFGEPIPGSPRYWAEKATPPGPNRSGYADHGAHRPLRGFRANDSHSGAPASPSVYNPSQTGAHRQHQHGYVPDSDEYSTDQEQPQLRITGKQ